MSHRVRSLRVAVAGCTAALLAWALGAGCDGAEPLHPVPDSVGPRVNIIIPTSQSYDEDGDGLVDLRVEWSDSLGAVDPASARVRLITGSGPVGADTNLLATWRVVRRDAAGLETHESLASLLGAGGARLEISVADTAGNERADTMFLALPEAALVRTISSGRPPGSFSYAFSMTLCSEDKRLYATIVDHLWVVDPDSLRTIAIIPPAYSTTAYLARAACIPGDPLLYVTENRLRRFDRAAGTWFDQISSSFGSVGIALSRRDPDLIYEGESYDGVVGVISRSQRTRRQLLPLAGRAYTNIDDIVALPNDSKLYITYGDYGGVWALDPDRDSVLARIRISNPGYPDNGGAQDMVLSADASRLYVAVTDGGPGGVVEIDTRTDSVLRRLNLPNDVPINLDLSPDGRRLFLTTQDPFPNMHSSNMLIDVATFTPIRFFPRPHPDGTTRFDRAVLFRPDGKYIFVLRDTDMDIYLYRP